MISSVHILEDHSAPLKNPGYNAAQLPFTLQSLFQAGYTELRLHGITLIRQLNTLRLYQSMMATRYIKPCSSRTCPHERGRRSRFIEDH